MKGADPHWPDSRAILIGVSSYRDPLFPDVPAAANSLTRMADVLTAPSLCGWPTERVTVLANPSDSRDVVKTIRRLAQETGDVLLLYYVGHGTLTPTGELCLALSDTDAEAADLTGLEYARIRAAFRDSPARVKAAILDCCYSGRAIETLADEATLLADHTDVRGVYTLTASDLAAHVPPPEAQAAVPTSFIGELLDLIHSGIPGQGDRLTLGTLYAHLRRRLRTLGLPDPNQRGTDTAHSFAFTRNAAGHSTPAAAERAAPPEEGSGQGEVAQAAEAADGTRPIGARPGSPGEIAPPAARTWERSRPTRRGLLVASGTVAGAAVATSVAIGLPGLLSGLMSGQAGGTPSKGTRSSAGASPGGATSGVPAFGTPLGRTLVGDPDMTINAVAVGALSGKVIAVTGDGLPNRNPNMPDDPDQGGLRVWDLAGGKEIGTSVKNGSRIYSVALGELDDKPIAVTGCRDNAVRVWDLDTGRQIGSTLKAQDVIFDVALGTLEGKSVVVALSLEDIRVWDLRLGTQIGAAIVMPEGFQINDMAIGTLNGRMVAVAGGYDHELRVWDLADFGETGKAMRHGKTISALAVTVVNGKTVAVANYGVGMRMWDLTTRKRIGGTFGVTAVSMIAAGTLNGQPIVVADHVDGGVEVWDLVTRTGVGNLLNTGTLTSLATASVNGMTVAAACTQYTVQGWILGPS